MARPVRPATIHPTSVELPIEVRDEIEALAKKEMRSKTMMIVILLKEALAARGPRRSRTA